MWRYAWLLPLGLFGAACSGRTETIVVAGGAGGAQDGGAAGASGGQGGVGGSGGLAVFCPDGPGPELVAVESPAGGGLVGPHPGARAGPVPYNTLRAPEPAPAFVVTLPC